MKYLSGDRDRIWKPIPPREIKNARVAIITEVPGLKGLAHGNYWTGRGMDIIIKTLKNLGISYEDTEIFFVFDKVVRKRGKEKYNKEAIKACRTQLILDLMECDPEVIIPLGTTALHALMNDFSLKIKENCGGTLQHNSFPYARIIPEMHPAIYYNSPGGFKVFYKSMEKVKDYLDGIIPSHVPDTEWSVVRTEEDVQNVIKFLKDKNPKWISLDIEATGTNMFDSPHTPISEILTFGLAYEPGKAFAFSRESIKYCQPLFDLPIPEIWHGGQFDKLFTRELVGLDIPIHHDCMLAHYTLNETSGTHDLGQLAVRYLDVDPYKSEANAYIRSAEGFGSAPLEVQYKRGCVDSDYTLRIFEQLIQKIDADEGFSNIYYNLLIPGTNAYVDIEQNGLKLSRETLEEFRVELERDKKIMINKMNKWLRGVWDAEKYAEDVDAGKVPTHFNPNSWKQKRWLIYDKLKLKPRVRKGKSTAQDVISTIPDAPEIINMILDYQSIQKELSTYVKGFLKRMGDDDRVHSNFKLYGTATGRRSSVGPNVQNLPARKGRNFRRAVIPRDGYVLAEVDYSGAELRALAMYSRDLVLRKVLEDGSLHDVMSVTLYGEDFTKAQRIRAKAANFGWAYGRTAQSLAEEHDIPLQEAEYIFQGLAEKFPKAQAYLDQCALDAVEGNPIRTATGRAKRPGLVTQRSYSSVQNEYKNYRMQSTISDFILGSVIDLHKEGMLQCEDTYVVNEVHDSILFEIKDDDEVIERVTSRIVQIMGAQPMKLAGWDMEFTCDVEIGYTWEDIVDISKFKHARPYLKDGMTSSEYKEMVSNA